MLVWWAVWVSPGRFGRLLGVAQAHRTRRSQAIMITKLSHCLMTCSQLIFELSKEHLWDSQAFSNSVGNSQMGFTTFGWFVCVVHRWNYVCDTSCTQRPMLVWWAMWVSPGRFARVAWCCPSEQNTSFSQAILITKLSHFFDDLFPVYFRTQ